MDLQPIYSRTLRNFLTSQKQSNTQSRPLKTLPAELKQHVDQFENQEGKFEGEIDRILQVFVSEKKIPVERKTLLSTSKLKKYRIIPEEGRKLPESSSVIRLVRLHKSISKVDTRLNTKEMVANSKHLLSYYPISNLRTEMNQINDFPQIITKDYMRHLRPVPHKPYYPI